MDPTDTLRTSHPETVECTFFSSARGTLSRRDHMLGLKTNLNKFKKTQVTPCLFSNHNTMKLEINRKKKSGKNTNTWRLNNVLLNNEWVNQEIRGNKKIHEDK